PDLHSFPTRRSSDLRRPRSGRLAAVGKRVDENSRRGSVTKKEEVDARGFKHMDRDFRDRDPSCLGRRSGAPHPPFDDSLFNVESPGACFRERSASEQAREQSCHTSWKAKAGTRKNAGVSRE